MHWVLSQGIPGTKTRENTVGRVQPTNPSAQDLLALGWREFKYTVPPLPVDDSHETVSFVHRKQLTDLICQLVPSYGSMKGLHSRKN